MIESKRGSVSTLKGNKFQIFRTAEAFSFRWNSNNPRLANTASLTFDHVKLDPNWVLSKEGTDYIAKTRPNFLGFQFGLAFGLAQRSLDEVEASLNSNRSVLREEFEATRGNLLAIQDQLFAGLNDANYFIEKPRELFK